MANPYYSRQLQIQSVKPVDRTCFLDFLLRRLTCHSNATYTLERIRVANIVPLTRYVYERRIETAERLIDLYGAHCIGLFEPILVRYEQDLVQLVSPPIIERRQSQLVLCDGTHRVFSVRRRECEGIIAVAVDGVTVPLPGVVNQWGFVERQSVQKPASENFICFNPEGLTGYTKVFNGPNVWLAGASSTLTDNEILSRMLSLKQCKRNDNIASEQRPLNVKDSVN
ncbi:MAG: hypothetical protein ABFD54_12960 [Armatimonadota bacterium]|nr:hypothetical protein [bacterium]